ncbi:hypothetical protein KUTeg_005107 [Tegillarca granosa]|uniref:Sodium-dependent multivitamin transporter n=1 Tax=Tegillarca granosa TaxID=220873 RepID=A0ABQ9FNC6_TEGGR|nr:hypothetical protein KUTeg_005107 [Tegillarca granosa]
MQQGDVTDMLGYVDYIVFAVTLILSFSIGIYYSRTGGKQRTIEEYLTGNRKIQCLPVAVSLLVTFQSGISLLGLPVEIYYYGTQISMGIIGLVLGYVFVAIFLVPVFHPLQLTSAYEYLEMRFQSRFVRLLGCTLGLLFTITYMAVALFIPALALEAVTGFPVLISVIVTSVVVVGYTMVALKQLCGQTLDPDPTYRQTLWAVTIGTITSWMGNAISQSGIQRICSTSSIADARKAILFNIPAAVIYEGVMAFMGLVIFAYYTQKGCDPADSGQIKSSNQLVPYFMMEHLSVYPGLAGLFVACLFSATLSTLSSGCVSFRPLYIIHCHLYMSAISAIAYKFIYITTLSSGLSAISAIITIGSLSATSGPMLGIFLLGAVFPWATSKNFHNLHHIPNVKSTIIAGFLSFCFVLTMSLGAKFFPVSHPKLPPVSTAGCSNLSFPLLSNSTAINFTLDSNSFTDVDSGVNSTNNSFYPSYTSNEVTTMLFNLSKPQNNSTDSTDTTRYYRHPNKYQRHMNYSYNVTLFYYCTKQISQTHEI